MKETQMEVDKIKRLRSNLDNLKKITFQRTGNMEQLCINGFECYNETEGVLEVERDSRETYENDTNSFNFVRCIYGADGVSNDFLILLKNKVTTKVVQ